MTCQARRSPAPALNADPRAIELLATARMRNDISDDWESAGQKIVDMKEHWEALNKPASEIAELQTMLNWGQTVYDRLLAMADECGKEFTALDENVRDEAEQALG